MIYIFSGTHDRYDREKHDELLRKRIAKMTDGTQFVTGAAFGVDTFACQFAYEYFPEAQHTIVVPAKWHNETHVELASKAPNVSVIRCPEGTDYRYRNTEMVKIGLEDASLLVCFPWRKLMMPGSGTWMTYNIATSMGVDTEVQLLP